MKNMYVLLITVAMASLTACGQKGKDVPPEVKDAFSQKFPGASEVKWGMENESEWEAEFVLNGMEYSANFDLSGTWKETEYKIDPADIPAAVKATLNEDFGNYTVEISEVTETKDGKAFEFDLKKGKEELSVSIDINGTVLGKEQMETEDEDD